MKRKITLIITFLQFFFSGFSQIIYDFENLNLSDWTQSQPDRYTISTDNPLNGLASLHHNYDNPYSGNDQISLQTNIDLTQGTVVWKFKIKHGYNPSSSNNWGVILVSDTNALGMTSDGSFNGYAIGVDFMNFSDDTLTLYRIDAGIPVPILKTNVNWQTEVGTNNIGAITVIRQSDGMWEVFFSISNSYDSISFLGQVFDNTYSLAKHFGIYYEYTSAQDRKLWFDDLEIYKMFNQTNAKFYLSTIYNTIESFYTSSTGKELASVIFTLTDTASNNIEIKQIIFTPASNNAINNWRDLFSGILFNFQGTNYQGIINENTLIFNTNITIQPGDSLQGTISAWVKTNPKVLDNSQFSLLLSDNHIICNPNLKSFSQQKDSTELITYSVEASKLSFEQVPLSIIPGQNFYTKIIATDDNYNWDMDANFDVTISADGGNGTLSSTSTLTKTMSNGIVEWNDLSYNQFDNFRILAYSQELGGFLSPLIYSSTYLYFLNDDFEDSDISDWQQSHPGHWIASNENPINGSFSLRQIYDNNQSATEWISHKVCCVDLSDTTIIWKFSVRFDNSSPSSSNNWNVVLMSDNNPIDSSSFNGYAIGINWDATDDLIKLWKIENGNINVLGTSSFNYDTQTQAGQIVPFFISRTSDGVWKVAIDTLNNDSFDTIITVNDNQFTQANYFAFRYQYTSTLDRKLSFDDVYFGHTIPDTIPPRLDTVIAISADTLLLYFNENINITNISNTNFEINNSITVQNITSLNSRVLKLRLSDTLAEDTIYTINCLNINDASGNTALLLTKTFKWIGFHISYIEFSDSLQLTIYFNRQIDTSSISINSIQIQNYSGTITNLLKENTKLTIYLNQPLTLFNTYFLKTNAFHDLNGNPLKDSVYKFVFYLPNYGDIVINEIMFDVNPEPPALPPYKYIELFNRTNIDINLNGWSIKINDSYLNINKNLIINPLSYVIICSEQAYNYFSQITPSASILNESYLTTTGKTITILSTNNVITDQITYSTQWYGDPDKDNGGWSVERIDPNNLCNQNNNWHASENPIGGTPGFINSVFDSNQDTIKPQILDLTILSSTKLKLTFNKRIAPETASTQINYILNNSVTPLIIANDENDANSLILTFLVSFNNGQNTLFIQNLQDFCNNIITDTTINFTYEKIHPIDVEPISFNTLKIYFSEPVEKTSAEQTSNYYVFNSVGYPLLANVDNQDNKIVYLIFNSNMTENMTYNIAIMHITDLNNNQIDSTVLSFTPHTAQSYDVIFNEFMTDINPEPLGLYPTKYIELYNTRDFDIWLTNWILSIDDNNYILPPYKIKANDYLLIFPKDIYTDTALSIFNSSYVKTTSNYSLYSSQGQIIDLINLNENFWNAPELAKGGISTEKINPNIKCQSIENWSASISQAGGTPGKHNSILTLSHQIQSTYIEQIKAIDAYNLNLVFNTPILNNSVLDINNYSINNLNIADLQLDEWQNLKITSSQPFISGNNTLKINISDDCGNNLNQDLNFFYEYIHVKRIIPIDSNILLVEFSETPYQGIYEKQNYIVNNNMEPNQIIQNQQNTSQIFLIFTENFNLGTNDILIKNIKDKFNNKIPEYHKVFVYYIPQKGDIVINELLFDPLPNNAKYIELYNNSEFEIYLNNLYLANLVDSLAENIIKISEEYLTFNPHDFLCITTDTISVKENYPVHGTNFLQINSLPSLPSTEGNIAVLYRDSVIDFFEYSEKMHSPIILDPEGIALERINFDLETNSFDNWTSASENVNFGTPAAENSQYQSLDSLIAINAELSLSSHSISPDNDGYEDFLLIKITSQEPNLIADIKIITHSGRIIKELVNNAVLGSENIWRWDATDNNNSKVSSGIYIIIAKIFNTQGRFKIIKKPIAVTKLF